MVSLPSSPAHAQRKWAFYLKLSESLNKIASGRIDYPLEETQLEKYEVDRLDYVNKKTFGQMPQSNEHKTM